MSAASLATSVAESTEMPTSAACRATASLTPSPRKATSTPRAAGDLDDPRLLVGADPGEHGRARDGVATARRRRGCSISAPVRTALDVEPDVAAHLGRDGAVVAGDDLDRDAERSELGDRLAGVGLGRVDEGEEPGQVQIALVLRTRSAGVAHLPYGDGDHPGAVARTGAPARRRRLLRQVDAPAQHRLGRSLRDEQRNRRPASGPWPTPAAARGRTAAVRAARTPASARRRRAAAATTSALVEQRCLPPARRR